MSVKPNASNSSPMHKGDNVQVATTSVDILQEIPS